MTSVPHKLSEKMSTANGSLDLFQKLIRECAASPRYVMNVFSMISPRNGQAGYRSASTVNLPPFFLSPLCIPGIRFCEWQSKEWV